MKKRYFIVKFYLKNIKKPIEVEFDKVVTYRDIKKNLEDFSKPFLDLGDLAIKKEEIQYLTLTEK